MEGTAYNYGMETKPRRPVGRLPKPLLKAITAALTAALAGEFDGGDFDGMDPKHFERALAWAEEQLASAARKAKP